MAAQFQISFPNPQGKERGLKALLSIFITMRAVAENTKSDPTIN